ERLFQENTNNKSQETFKQLLRNLRFEVENVGAKKWLIASTKQREGKTFTAVGLAYSLCLNNKKVLLIDTNFKNNTLSKLPINTTTEYAHILQTTIQRYGLQNAFQTGGNLFENDGAMVDVVSCRSNNLSVSEILAGKDFRAFVDELATKYDYLFFEGPALNDFTDTKEIVNYADKVLMVVSAKSKVYSSDQFSINYLQQINGKLKGAVLNQIELKNI
ncbi:MAG TPA: AAA family ATPase, partial [Chitinophagales bacterium]|nr:AAA family ATPase [Chitinophagales bacterium]